MSLTQEKQNLNTIIELSPKIDRHSYKNEQESFYYIETYGCQMNEYDSGLVSSILEANSFHKKESIDGADLILINTCAIREKAHEKIYHRLQNFLPLKRKNPKLLVGILGCMAQNLGDDLFAMGLPIDFIVGPDNYKKLPELIKDIRESYTHSISRASSWNLTHLSRHETYQDLQAEVVNGKLAFITIMRGCDNFCSFCVVPFTRGRERSREPNSIIQELQNLISKYDVKEVTLLGQNVNSYKHEKYNFKDLVQKILDETSIERIRFTSPHPHDFPEDLLDLIHREKRFCSQIHLPLQSGSNEVLKRMKRDYTREEYMTLVDKMRNKIPELGLTTDIIVGFCQESEKDFEQTLDLVRKVRFDMAYMFHYSEREMTSAKKYLDDDIPEVVKLKRLDTLIQLQREISKEINESLLGKKFDVLVESFSRKNKDELMGRADSGKVFIFPPPNYPSIIAKDKKSWLGKTFSVKVVNASSAALRGEIILI